MLRITSTTTSTVAASREMQLLKNLSLSTFSMGARLLASLAAISVVARVLGAEGFGNLMIQMSTASILIIASNLGLNSYVLREIGHSQEDASTIISANLTAKIILSAFMATVWLTLAMVNRTYLNPVFSLLLLALWIETLTEFMNMGLRATGRFAAEAKQSLLAAVINSSFVIAAAVVGKSLIPVALAYVASRALVLLVATGMLRHAIGTISISSIQTGLIQLKRAASYAVDAMLSSLFGQVDGLVLGIALPASAVGIYQGGLRLFMAASTAAGSLTNVLLPKLSAEMKEGNSKSRRFGLQGIVVFSVFGNLIGCIFALPLPSAVTILYGHQFAPLATLLPWFGVLFAVRLTVGGWGLLLTAKGLQGYRSSCILIHWISIACLSLIMIPRYGSVGWIISMIISTVLLGILYIRYALEYVRPRGIAILVSCLPLLWAPLVRQMHY